MTYTQWDCDPVSGESDYGQGYHYITPCVGQCTAARNSVLLKAGGIQAYREQREADQYAKYHVDESDCRPLTFDASKPSERWSAHEYDIPVDLPVEVVNHGLFGRRKK